MDGGSYDPKLGLAYFGVGQTYDTGPVLHRVPGFSNDGLFTDCTLAFDPASGKLVWYFQHVHNDQWDLDWAFEQQLIHLPVDGADQKLVVTSGKMGIYEGMDAATGEYIFSHDLGIQNVISSIDPKTGEKTINPEVVIGDGKPHMICPHPAGTKLDRRILRRVEEDCLRCVQRVVHGFDFSGAGPAREFNSGVNWFIRLRPDSDGKIGRVEAFNLETRKCCGATGSARRKRRVCWIRRAEWLLRARLIGIFRHTTTPRGRRCGKCG